MTLLTKQAQKRNPMWYFERNFALLLRLIRQTNLLERSTVQFRMAGSVVTLRLKEQTRYTLLIEIQQGLSDLHVVMGDLNFNVRLYLDASVAEVISYQGRQRLAVKYPYPNQNMFHPDEKRQTNLVLFDWLSSCSRLNYKECILEKYCN